MPTTVTFSSRDLVHSVSCSTHYAKDGAMCAMLIRSARSPEEKTEIIDELRRKRAGWLTWLTLTQREWQTHQRRVSLKTMEARNRRWGGGYELEKLARADLESYRTREQYVRCAM